MQSFIFRIQNKDRYMEKIFLVKGGLANTPDNPIKDDFYLITKDFKRNHGYIGKRSDKVWRLYTPLGYNKSVTGGKSNYYHHYPTFEECVEKLKELSQSSIDIVDNYYREKISLSKEEVKMEYGPRNETPWNENSALTQLFDANFTLTPGANFKLELFLESSNDEGIIFSQQITNATTFNMIIQLHNERIEKLKAELQGEMSIIRPEDIPNFN